jgi:hypothetical protein
MATGAAVSVAMPTLDQHLNGNGLAFADGTPIPRRFGVWYWGNGVKPKRFHPKEIGPDYTLTDELQPFANVRRDMSVVTGSTWPWAGRPTRSARRSCCPARPTSSSPAKPWPGRPSTCSPPFAVGPLSFG